MLEHSSSTGAVEPGRSVHDTPGCDADSLSLYSGPSPLALFDDISKDPEKEAQADVWEPGAPVL